MAGKQNGPNTQPIHELDRRLDAIIGYDHLIDMVADISVGYPDDLNKTSLQEIAVSAIHGRRQEELEGALDLKKTIRREKLISRLRVQALASMDSDEVGIVQAARFTVGRPIEKTPPKLPKESHAEVHPIVTDPLTITFLRAVHILRFNRRNILYERKLVMSLYPELYVADRAEAYRRFDDFYERSKLLDSKNDDRLQGVHIQKGKLYKSSHKGEPVEEAIDTLYRGLRGNDEQISAQAGIRQIVNGGKTKFVILWEEVTP